jgi:hypothetical protein
MGNKGVTPRIITGRQEWYEISNEVRGTHGPMPRRSGPKQKEWLRKAAKMMYHHVEKRHVEDGAEPDGYIKFKRTQRLEENMNEKSSRERKNEVRRLERRLGKTRKGSSEYMKATQDIKRLKDEAPMMTYKKVLGEGVARLTQDSRNLTPQQRWEREPMDSMTVRDTWGEPQTKPRDYFYPSKSDETLGMMAEKRDPKPVSTGSLFDTSRLSDVPDVPQVPVSRFDPPQGQPKMLDDVFSRKNTNRVNKIAQKGMKMADPNGTTWNHYARPLLTGEVMPDKKHSIS